MKLVFRNAHLICPLFFLALAACAHRGVGSADPNGAAEATLIGTKFGLKSTRPLAPVELRLKATVGRAEKVAYLHRSLTKNLEISEVRNQKEESLEFVSQAQTLKAEPSRFTQSLQVISKDGKGRMHDFAMPEPGEKLNVTSDSLGKILKAGDYPTNSVFYVSPLSLPQDAVTVGDTWTMQASWLSLEEMVPFQLDMISILKEFWNCGTHRCAEIEIQGDVALQGTLTKTMEFKSGWKGGLIFDIDAGTVLYSRVNSQEEMVADRVRREIHSCLEALLIEPADIKIPRMTQPTCAGFNSTSGSTPSASL